jgi:GDP-L-fucose synthase
MTKRIFVAGHQGMVGSAIARQLLQDNNVELVTRTRAELDLSVQQDVADFFASEQIDEVYLGAAKVGGIHANNTYPAEFIYDNLMVECNVVNSAWKTGVQKLLFLGSSCIYPRLANQPMKEEELMQGSLEPTNEPYALAKIAGIKLCESYNRQYGTDYRSVMPTNLYGPHDNYHPENSHVIPALLRRFHEARLNNADSVTIWGTGSALREFLHVDDMARASIHVMNLPLEEYQQITDPRLTHINVGSGVDCSIRELVTTVSEVTGFQGNIEWDASKPDGAPRKLMDNAKLKSLGWQPQYTLKEGLIDAYNWYVENIDTART